MELRHRIAAVISRGGRPDLVIWNRSSTHYKKGVIVDAGLEAGGERMNERSAGVTGKVAILPDGLKWSRLANQILAFTHASRTKHAGHYASNFGFT